MVKPTPKILYKYRCFSARSISMLANNQIYFASPQDFNDPFDCSAYEHMFDDLREDSLEELARLHPAVSPEAITSENTQRFKEAFHRHPEIIRIKQQRKVDHENFLATVGILSLSECNNSILMWSHYANFHKGFCIGFKNNLGLGVGSIREVGYTDERGNDLVREFLARQGKSAEEQNELSIKRYILTKYHDWKYEQEWRSVGEQGQKTYPVDCIDSIIFGLNMALDERKTICHLLRDKHVKFFEAIKSTRHFAVDIIEHENKG